MKPLVLYCRWHNARLRLRGRSESAVWGELVFVEADSERVQPFRYELQARRLTLGPNGSSQALQLDEMGVVVGEA